MTEQEIQAQLDHIESVHKSCMERLLQLQKEQDKIIMEFSEVLKNKELEKVRKEIGTI